MIHMVRPESFKLSTPLYYRDDSRARVLRRVSTCDPKRFNMRLTFDPPARACYPRSAHAPYLVLSAHAHRWQRIAQSVGSSQFIYAPESGKAELEVSERLLTDGIAIQDNG